jgi:NAD(P)-dependent dehydrogenase (short-subunit alcohol dehydrogenase family)
MDLELDGKVAVVTGASKGIGLAVVRTIAAEGAAVVAGARTVDALAAQWHTPGWSLVASALRKPSPPGEDSTHTAPACGPRRFPHAWGTGGNLSDQVSGCTLRSKTSSPFLIR